MIKEQCDNCKKFNSTCKEIVEFNEKSCALYQKKGIDLEKRNETKSIINDENRNTSLFDATGTAPDECEEFVYTREFLKENTTISGWFLFFCLSVVVGGFISFVYPVLTFDVDDYSGSYILGLADVVPGFLLFVLSILTLLAINRRDTDAIFLAKTYVIVCFAYNLIVLFVGGFEDNKINCISSVVRSLLWAVIWFLYLIYSDQVQENFPSEYRKSKPRDWYIIAAIVILPLFFTACGIIDINNMNDRDNRIKEESQKQMIQNSTLQSNEVTDGRIIFKIDDLFTYSDTIVDNLKIFYLDSDYCSVTLCSEYEPDKSFSNIDSYWNDWEDESFKNYLPNIKVNEVRKINGNTFHYRVKEYEINDNIIYWRFGMLFDSSSDKVCVISSYDSGIDSYIKPLVESIRFHQ